MAEEVLRRDQNHVTVLGGITDDSNEYVTMLRVDPSTKRLLVSATGLGVGTVTSISGSTGILLTPDPITTTGTVGLSTALAPMATLAGNALKFLRVNAGETALEYATAGTGTVTTVSVVTANGVSGSVANATTTPAITLTLGAITPTTVNGNTFTTGSSTYTGTAGQTYTFPSTSATVAGLGIAQTFSALQTFSLAGVPVRIVNTTDAAANQGIKIESDRATPAANDTVYESYLLSNSTGTQFEFARITATGTTVTASSESGSLTFAVANAGAFSSYLTLSAGALKPAANDATALGSTTLQFSDLFLAEGGVINFDNGDATITQSGDTITVGGADLLVTTAGTAATSVVNLSATQTLTNKTLTSPVLTTPSAFTTGGTITLAENTSVALDPAGSADGKYTGITVAATAGYTQAFGDLVYLDPTDSRWEACDANSAAGADGDSRGLIGMVVVAGTDGNACTILLNGIIRADAKFPSFTINNPIYVSETAGAVTQTQPTTTDVVIRIVGAALTADEMYFNPDNTWVTHT